MTTQTARKTFIGSDTKRRTILDGARSIFLAHGYGGASMDQVAAAASVSKMTLYRYFVGKEQLFAGVVEDLCERIADDALSAAMETLPPEQALRAFAKRILATLFDPDTIELHRIVIAESRRFPELGRLFYQQGPEGSVGILEAYLRNHADDPRLRIGSPRIAAEEFLSLLRGYAHLRILLGIDALETCDLQGQIDSAVAHLTP
jgi:TetR/AcrR family transcriptional repressor of mexJK operon